MANSSLSLSSLDFDTLKLNLKSFLSSQSVFKDYDFDGSNINVLLDVLTYNSYLNSFYLNMIASEMFLDSAQKLDSVISHAKELNYLPRSKRSAKAVVSFTLDTTGISNPLVVQKGTVFTGTNANGIFTFVTDETNSYLSTNSTYTISNLEIYEGFYTRESFVVDYNIEDQKFSLSDSSIDTNSLEVIVSESNSNTIYTYTDSLFGITSNSAVYFLQGTESNKYEIFFGDDVFGKKPKNGAIIYTSYRVCNGADGNSISAFNLSSDIGANNGGASLESVINVVAGSTSGANAEDINSIKFNAPRHFQTQGRCITVNDYKTTILQNFPEIQYVNVYGGQVTNSAVEFGTVYISPSTYSGNQLTDLRKQDVRTFVNNLTTIGIITKIIDPEYLYVNINSTIHVNFSNTTSSTTNITAAAIQAAKTYNVNNLQNFNTAFRMSKFSQTINEADVGILSNEIIIEIYKSFTPPINTVFSITCEYNNSIKKGSVYSSNFTTGGVEYYYTDFVENVDSGSGILYKVEKTTATNILNYTEAGRINYSSGSVTVVPIEYFNIGAGLKLFAIPEKQDVYCYNNTIISLDTISGLNFNIVSN
jgi:hypothetical protein